MAGLHSAWTADSVTDWLPELVRWLRETGVEEIKVRLDKEFYAERVVRTLQELKVSYLFKVPNHGHIREQLGFWRAFKTSGPAAAVIREDLFDGQASRHTSPSTALRKRSGRVSGLRPS